MPTKRSQDFMDLKNGSDKKASKPLIEKRRRARINHSLAQLKALVIDSKTESTRQTKLEKADILEMTVQHLKEIKKHQTTVPVLDMRQTKKKYEIGYIECARQVELFLANLVDPRLTEVEENLKRRLKDHLLKSLQDHPRIDENSHTDKFKETSSPPPSLLKALPSNSPSDIKNDQNNMLQKRHEDSIFWEDVAQSNSGLETKHSIKTSYDRYESDEANNYDIGHSQYDIGNSKIMSQQDILRSETLQSYSSFPEKDAFVKARFNPSPNSLDRYQSSPSSSDSNSASFEQEWLNLKTKHSNDINHRKTQQFCPTSFQQNTAVQQELHKNTSTLKADRYNENYQQISLVPRRLSNGEWALVLPGNFTLTENDTHSPLSAFKLVWPTISSELDNDHQTIGRASGSPLSSSVSDLSSEDYNYRMDVEAHVKIENDGQTDFGFVWRPW